MKKTKGKSKKILKKPIAKYIGDAEVMFSQFKKIINKGELMPGISIKEAKARRDFIVVNGKEKK